MVFDDNFIEGKKTIWDLMLYCEQSEFKAKQQTTNPSASYEESHFSPTHRWSFRLLFDLNEDIHFFAQIACAVC